MLPEIAPEELSEALDHVALDALKGAGTNGPPVNAFAAASALGLVVAWDDRQSHNRPWTHLEHSENVCFCGSSGESVGEKEGIAAQA